MCNPEIISTILVYRKYAFIRAVWKSVIFLPCCCLWLLAGNVCIDFFFAQTITAAPAQTIDPKQVLLWIQQGDSLLEKQQLKSALVQYVLADSQGKATLTLAQQAKLKKKMADIYFNIKEYRPAYQYYIRADKLSDSLLNLRNKATVDSLRARYAHEQVDRKISAETDNALIRIYVNLGLGVVVIGFAAIGFLLYRRYRLQRQFQAIQQRQLEVIQNRHAALDLAYEQVEQQKKALERQMTHIADSIEMAQRIQDALLPDSQQLFQAFPNAYVFYQPKDVVSGDFYWFEYRAPYAMLATIDCTGHGVPGAFMSVVAYNLLNHLILDLGLRQPGKILEELDQRVNQALHQGQDSQSRDGMDLSLAIFDFDQQTCTVAAAHHSTCLLRNGQIDQFKGNRYPVGGAQHAAKTFDEQVIALQTGDRLFWLSDGITDQFGGPNHRKFGFQRFADFLNAHQQTPLNQFEHHWPHTIHQWMGTAKQLDDMLFIAVQW